MQLNQVTPCYCTNLRRAAGAATEYYDSAFQPLGLSAAQYYLLANLSRMEPVNTTRLAGQVRLDRSTLVRNLRILQKYGWVDDRHVGREHRFYLPEAGREILSQAEPLWKKAQENLESRLGQEDAAELMRLLQKVQDLKDL